MTEKFKASDLDEEAQIAHSGVVKIATDLGLKLSSDDLEHFIDVNFRCVDSLCIGRISVGQYLTCCTGLLYSYDMCQVWRHPQPVQQVMADAESRVLQ